VVVNAKSVVNTSVHGESRRIDRVPNITDIIAMIMDDDDDDDARWLFPGRRRLWKHRLDWIGLDRLVFFLGRKKAASLRDATADDDDDDDRDARAILRCASTIAIPSSFSKPGTDPTSEPFTISCRQTSVSSDWQRRFFVSVHAATSGAVGFGAWFATLRFAPIPSEIRPIVVAVRLRAKNETNPKSNQPTKRYRRRRNVSKLLD
jgi:hypothetical protein